MKKILTLLVLTFSITASAQISQTFKNVTVNDTLKTASDSLLLIKGHIVPTSDSSLNIGTALLRWNRCYIDTLDTYTILGQVYEQEAIPYADNTGTLTGDSNAMWFQTGYIQVGDRTDLTGASTSLLGWGEVHADYVLARTGEINMFDSVDFLKNAVFSGNTRTIGITQLGQTPQSTSGVDSMLMKSSVGQVMVLPWQQGRYLPDDSASSNVASFSFDSANYTLQGDYVTVSGVMTVDPTTTATPTFWYQSLPILPNFQSISEGAGTFVGHFINEAGAVFVGSSLTRIEFYFTPTNTADRYISYSFTYKYR